MNAKQSFKSVYALTRLNRNNIHFRHQFFRFADDTGCIFVGDNALVISRNGRYITEQPGYLAGCVGNNSGYSVDFRKHYLDRSREVGRVPLP